MLPTYDDKAIFESYKKMRQAEGCYNDFLEQPAMTELIGDVTGKRILDVGCGWGDGAKRMAEAGAEFVFAMDPSKNMLAQARKINDHPAIHWAMLGVEIMDTIERKFDIAVSSVMLHYIKDLSGAFEKINRRLVDGGTFVFSMEHPIRTANITAQRWQLADDGDDKPVSLLDAYIMDGYWSEGFRKVTWIGKRVNKNHRRMETIVNSLIDAGFVIDRMLEPLPTPEMIQKFPGKMGKAKVRPQYLIIKCHKQPKTQRSQA